MGEISVLYKLKNKMSNRLNILLSSILIMMILGALWMLIYTIPMTKTEFTEFYILGVEGNAIDHPRTLKVGDEFKVIVGIANHEGEEIRYEIEVRLDGEKVMKAGPIVLDSEKKWEESITFSVENAGEQQKVELLLYKQGETNLYRSLYLWVDVK